MRARCTENRSKKYLFPILNTYGPTFIKQLDSLTNYVKGYPISQSILEIGISDVLYYRAKNMGHIHIKDYPYLFIVFDINGIFNPEKNTYLNIGEGRNRFSLFLKYIRSNKNYVCDYWYKKHQHCIVFNLYNFSTAFERFIESKYSKMYTDEDLKILKIPQYTYKGETKYHVPEYVVLKKIKDAGKKYLQNKIYESYGIDVIPEDPKEFDIPWFPESEFLNFNYFPPQELEKFIEYKRMFQ
jgi:hypothetical protein